MKRLLTKDIIDIIGDKNAKFSKDILERQSLTEIYGKLTGNFWGLGVKEEKRMKLYCVLEDIIESKNPYKIFMVPTILENIDKPKDIRAYLEASRGMDNVERAPELGVSAEARTSAEPEIPIEEETPAKPETPADSRISVEPEKPEKPRIYEEREMTTEEQENVDNFREDLTQRRNNILRLADNESDKLRYTVQLMKKINEYNGFIQRTEGESGREVVESQRMLYRNYEKIIREDPIFQEYEQKAKEVIEIETKNRRRNATVQVDPEIAQYRKNKLNSSKDVTRSHRGGDSI